MCQANTAINESTHGVSHTISNLPMLVAIGIHRRHDMNPLAIHQIRQVVVLSVVETEDLDEIQQGLASDNLEKYALNKSSQWGKPVTSYYLPHCRAYSRQSSLRARAVRAPVGCPRWLAPTAHDLAHFSQPNRGRLYLDNWARPPKSHRFQRWTTWEVHIRSEADLDNSNLSFSSWKTDHRIMIFLKSLDFRTKWRVAFTGWVFG